MSELNIEDRVYADGIDEPFTCGWFALCERPANGLRDAGPLGMVPICQRCDDKMTRIGQS